MSQELEIAGQRGARREATEHEVRAQDARVALTRRDVAAAAWVAYFDALAAEAELRLTREVEAASVRVAEVLKARAEQHLTASAEADLAEAQGIRALSLRAAAERTVQARLAQLATLLGSDPALHITVEGELDPLSNVDAMARRSLGTGAESRPEVQVPLAKQQAARARADAFRRARVPNPTLSVFAQHDEISDRLFGVGVSFPIPLPEPIGRLHAGDIAENDAAARRAANE